MNHAHKFSFVSIIVFAAALSLASLLILPPLIGLLPTPGAEVVGALAGLLAGWACRLKRRAELLEHTNDHI